MIIITKIINEMASTGKKVPTLNSEWNYAVYGQFKMDFASFLARNDMPAWSSLTEAKMPEQYPPELTTISPEEKKVHVQHRKFKAWGIDDEFEFDVNSQKAYGFLYEAVKPVPELNRVVIAHNGNFRSAFLALEEYIRGNLKTASRRMQKELKGDP